MKAFIYIFFMIIIDIGLASDELPFSKYFGSYNIVSCRKIVSVNNPIDWCAQTSLYFEKSPANEGAPHTNLIFSPRMKKGTKNGDWETFSTGKDLNPEYYKLNKDEDGSDHYYIRTLANEKTYIYTDFWMKSNTDGTTFAKFKRRETPRDSDSSISSFEFEFVLKKSL